MKRNKKRSLPRITIKWIFLTIYIIISLALTISMLAKYIDANDYFLPYLFALGFPYIFFTHLLLLLIVIYRKNTITFILSLPIIILGFVHFNQFFNITSVFNKGICEGQKINILSFNVRLFDLYNWRKNYPYKNEILNFIINQKPDIACLQEYYYQSDGKYPTTEVLKQSIKPFYIHESYPVVNRKRDYFGIATISRYPIINRGELHFENTANMCIYSDIVIGDDTVRVYNTHLESVRLSTEDYAFISTIEKTPENAHLSYTRKILNKLEKTVKKRNIQARKIAEHIANCSYKVIVCGDFNDVPTSYTYYTISKKLYDTYSLMDFKLGTTYNGSIPFLRIDYILHSKGFYSCNYTIHRKDLSDHYPVSCQLSFKKK